MSGAGGQGGSSMPDEEWERFLRESVEGAADAPVEPSARAREVQARLRKDGGQPQGWRTYTPARRGRRTAWYVTGLVAAVALVLVALFPQWVVGWFGGDGGGESAGTPMAAESERPTAAPGAEQALRPTLDEPFRGSPAARWADGPDGITVPPVRATGWMDAAQVERALRRSKEFMVAAGLDSGVLRGKRPERAIALLSPHQRDVREYLRAAFSSAPPTEETDPLLLFSRFRPDQTDLVGDIVKTRGRLTYREGERGAVEVTADVTFVYPVTPAAGDGGADAEVIRTIVRREVVMSWDDPSKVVTEPDTMSLVSYSVDMTNGGCSGPTGYFVPPFGRADQQPADESRLDPYDRSEPVGTATGADGCATATRS
ncbi:hypothetical protein AB0N42_12785 [Streptomyces pseudogriseolus]|uniref:hypothetical protein n=1 Tax=Streptomyces pseudogriseolus TaxID=36817 RepID=UPI0034744DDE